MVRLVGQEVTGACKAKAQSGALLRVGGTVVPFCLESGWRVRTANPREEMMGSVRFSRGQFCWCLLPGQGEMALARRSHQYDFGRGGRRASYWRGTPHRPHGRLVFWKKEDLLDNYWSQ